jgi:hypothetical protein
VDVGGRSFWEGKDVRSIHKKVIVGLAAGLLVGLLPVPASAEGSVDTETSIRKERRKRAVIIYGTLDVNFSENDSPDAEGCVEDRTVQVWGKKSGKDKRVPGVVHSDEDGTWAGRLTGKLDGKFYAKVTKKVFSDRYGELITCAPARSRVVKL